MRPMRMSYTRGYSPLRLFPTLDQFQWQEDQYTGDVENLYNLVVPEQDRETPDDQRKLLSAFPNQYQLYTCRDSKRDKKLTAMILFSVLQNTQALYIEIIAVHPDYRHLNISSHLFQKFIIELRKSEVKFNSVSIEAYLQNVEYFKNHLHLSDPQISYQVERCASPVVFLSTETNARKALDIISEWNAFTHKWPSVVSNNNFAPWQNTPKSKL